MTRPPRSSDFVGPPEPEPSKVLAVLNPDIPAFTPWLNKVSPELRWDFRHLAYIRKRLAQVTLGRVNRLIINCPAQFGKSQLVTIRYAVWRLLRNPRLRIAITAYGQRLAESFCRAARRLAGECGMAFGDVQKADEWETAEGGGVIARGMGAGITGRAVDLLLIDDPYKDAQQGASPVYQERVWEWWTDALMKRLSLGAQVVCTHTRWATNDLTGKLLERGGWDQVKIKAIAEDGDPLGRAVGETLCPELHSQEEIEEQRDANPISFVGMGQQEPIDKTGGFFKGIDELTVLPVAPAAEQYVKRVRSWDIAATEKQAGADPDWLVGTLMGKHKNNFYDVLDVVRVRVGPAGVLDTIRSTAARDGVGVHVLVEREGGSAGKMVAYDIVQQLAGYVAKGEGVSAGKAERAQPYAAQVEVKNVRVVKANWNAAWLDEHRAFPTGKHDDCVDSASAAFRELAKGGWSVQSVNMGR